MGLLHTLSLFSISHQQNTQELHQRGCQAPFPTRRIEESVSKDLLTKADRTSQQAQKVAYSFVFGERPEKQASREKVQLYSEERRDYTVTEVSTNVEQLEFV